jgi:hypothetical protein
MLGEINLGGKNESTHKCSWYSSHTTEISRILIAHSTDYRGKTINKRGADMQPPQEFKKKMELESKGNTGNEG